MIRDEELPHQKINIITSGLNKIIWWEYIYITVGAPTADQWLQCMSTAPCLICEWMPCELHMHSHRAWSRSQWPGIDVYSRWCATHSCVYEISSWNFKAYGQQDEIQYESRDSLYTCVYHIWRIYLIYEATKPTKWIWFTFSCLGGQSGPVAMKLKVDVSCQL